MRILLHLAYDGTDFHGCPDVPGQRTICGTLTEALGRVGLRPSLVETLSRTDAGVHADGNLGHVCLDRALPEAELLGILERHLPSDLRAHRVTRVDAVPVVVSKTYRYTLDLHRIGDPFLARYAWRPPGPLQLSQVRAALALFRGRQDFSAFGRTEDPRVDLVRTFDSVGLEQRGDRVAIEVVGQRFFYHLVRSVVGAAVMVGRGGASLDELRAALAGEAVGVARQTAPAKGLNLHRIVVENTATEG